MSTSTAISVIAINQANMAITQATQARKAAQCVGLMDGFTHASATVEQRQQYAECVGLLWPDADSVATPAEVSMLLITGLVGAVIGGWVGRNNWVESLLGAFLGAVLLPFATILGRGIWQATKYALGVPG